MKKHLTLLNLALSLPLTLLSEPGPASLTDSVDLRIGVLGEGHTVIGPQLPFASVNPSPDTPDGSQDGYHPDRPIRGFSQTHVSGTGWGQYGNILISPQLGLAVGETEHDSPKAEEKATPYEYRARLSRYDILAEFTPTPRAVIYQFTFPQSDDATIAIDAAHAIPGDIVPAIPSSVSGGEVNFEGDGRAVSGFGRYQGGFGRGIYKVYFHAEMDHAPNAVGTWKNGQISEGAKSVKFLQAKDRIGGFARFKTKAGEMVKLKIGISFKSVEQARENLQKEIEGWDYAQTRAAAKQTWEKALASIQIDEPDATKRTLFYTALYHASVMPRDRTGEFPRFDPKVPMWDDHYAIWDTWRTLYPLMVLIRPDMVRGTVQSFIERQRVDHSVGDTFVAATNRLQEQGGNGVDMIIADAHAKGVTGIDWEQAYGVLKFDADNRRTGVNPAGPFYDAKFGSGGYHEQGWLPAGIMSCSMTLEYAQNDFAAAQVVAALGKKDDAKAYFERSQKWQMLWNPDTVNDGFKGFIMPRKADLTWVEFDPKKYPGSWKPYFYEANAWTYSYFAPHQFNQLVTLMGGPETFTARLQHALDAKLLTLENEPSFLIPQLFHYVGRPDLTTQAVRKITTELFTLSGYPGDDDSGAMSSYYIWAKLGLFPNAGQDLYYLNAPEFTRAVVQRPEDGPLEITRTGTGDYVASVTLNGTALDRSWLRHAELKGNAKLAFTMSESPTKWGQANLPPDPELVQTPNWFRR